MPLDLDDPRWNDLEGSYGDTAKVVSWLREIYETRSPTDDLIGNLVNEVQHQGSTSTAMYAVAVHFIAMARDAPPETALDLLVHAGLVYADSGGPDAAACPSFIRSEFDLSAAEGKRMLSALLPTISDFDTFKYAVAALAGFAGYHAFGRLLVGFEFYEGRFHHDALSEPFPEE
jgi:hypothetical protein